VAGRFVTSEDDFRGRVREFLEANAPRREARDSGSATVMDVEKAQTFQRALFEAGLAGLSWPREYGGQGMDERFQTIFNDEAAAYDLPTGPFIVAFGMSLPTLLALGTEEQKQRYVAAAIRGDEMWCQLFSEPSAGSDLAGVRSSVVRDGDEWVLNGQKVWTTGAHFAQHALLLARTDFDAPKHAGLSMFILDMSSPGITIRPLRQMTGDADFNEVFFEDVRIPAGNILGAPGDGWRCATTLLMNERILAATESAEKTDRLAVVATHLRLARARGLMDDQAVRQPIMDLVVRYWAADLLGLRQRQLLSAGGVPGPEGSLNKLGAAINDKRSAAVAFRLSGPEGTAWDSEDSLGATAALELLSAPLMSIAGGTNQIVRNLLAERVLGLPKEPGFDKDTPFRDLPFS
jgi:alkylation response protein AidB-like acyl-CoA dehydrogenase